MIEQVLISDPIAMSLLFRIASYRDRAFCIQARCVLSVGSG